MPLTAAVQDLGTVSYGSLTTMAFSFYQGITPQVPLGVLGDPGSAALKLTAPGGRSIDVSASLTHVSAGTYTFPFSATVPGDWTGRGYAPPGLGQASVDLVIHVMETANP